MNCRASALVAFGLLLYGCGQPDSQLPDWSGVWMPVELNLFDPTAETVTGPTSDFFGTPRMFPPYNAEWEAKYVHEVELNASGFPRDPTARCLPPGMPRIMSSPYPWEFVVERTRVTMLKEYMSQVRRIYIDGRGHPPDVDPSFNGHSIGHWEGDVLVIDTVGLRDDTPYDRTGAPHSDQLHVVERMRKIGPDLIENILYLEDPVAFTKPWTVRRTYKRMPGWEISEYVCEENNRNPVDENGNTTITLVE
jgi:hypothetical protein